MKFINLGTEKEACHYVANELLKQIINDNKSVLGLATGGTMVGVYEQLVNLIKINKLDLCNTSTFKLYKYLENVSYHQDNYYTYMHDILFNHLSSRNKEKIHLPHGSVNDLNSEEERY